MRLAAMVPPAVITVTWRPARSAASARSRTDPPPSGTRSNAAIKRQQPQYQQSGLSESEKASQHREMPSNAVAALLLSGRDRPSF